MDAQKIIALIRNMRHDFGNHLQVILGYMDLGCLEEAKDYVYTVVKGMADDRTLFEQADAESALYLLNQGFLAKEMGIIIKFSEIKLRTTRLLAKENEPLKTLAQCREKLDNTGEEIVVSITLHEDDHSVEMVLAFAHGEADPIRIRIEE